MYVGCVHVVFHSYHNQVCIYAEQLSSCVTLIQSSQSKAYRPEIWIQKLCLFSSKNIRNNPLDFISFYTKRIFIMLQVVYDT